jgi:hypothetical protein
LPDRIHRRLLQQLWPRRNFRVGDVAGGVDGEPQHHRALNLRRLRVRGILGLHFVDEVRLREAGGNGDHVLRLRRNRQRDGKTCDPKNGASLR